MCTFHLFYHMPTASYFPGKIRRSSGKALDWYHSDTPQLQPAVCFCYGTAKMGAIMMVLYYDILYVLPKW